MVEELFITRFIMDLMPLAASSVSENELSKRFIERMKEDFGMDYVELSLVGVNKSTGTMEDYMVNTRKPYIDNKLSEFSAFPELAGYNSQSYRSCALVPLIFNGKVGMVLKLLSKRENRFDENTMHAIEAVSGFFSFSYIYKSEIRKNGRLAEYFDSSFDSSVPQMLVSSDNTIIKMNKAALKSFGFSNERRSIDSLFGINFDNVKIVGDKGIEVYLNVNNAHNVYSLTSNKISESLLHISAINITGKVIMDSFFASISESSDVYAVLIKDDFTIIAASKNFEKLLKYSENIFVNKKFIDLIKENEKPLFSSKLNEASGAPVLLNLNLAGSGFTVPTKAVIGRTIFGYLVTLVNAESEVYVTEANKDLDSFIESSSDIIIVVDEFGYIKRCNLPIEGILGFHKEELVGREIKSLYKDPSILDKDIAYVRNGSNVDNSFVDIIKKNFEVVSGVQSVRLIRGGSDGGRYMIVIKELETKHKLEDMELELREKENRIKRLESVGEQKSEFIYNISHELKTPLTNIKGYASLLSNGNAGELTESEKDYVSTILAEADRLMLIIQQVLDASKLEAKKVKFDFHEVDLRSIKENSSIKGLEEQAKSKGLYFKWEIDSNLPDISCDLNKLVQVFVNLIGNAVKFTEEGGITVSMFAKTKRTIECDIIDTGIGISEDDRKKLFRQFYQAQKKTLARQDGAGTGLGLSITKNIINLHGGKINVESKIGSGSKFWFTLPTGRRKRKEKEE